MLALLHVFLPECVACRLLWIPVKSSLQIELWTVSVEKTIRNVVIDMLAIDRCRNWLVR
jgi:hypothetical protein